MKGARFSPRKKTNSRKYCWVNGCLSQSQKDLDLRFHSVPRTGERYVQSEDVFGNVTSIDRAKAWRNALKMKNTDENVRVCSLYFKKSDYLLPGMLIYIFYMNILKTQCITSKFTGSFIYSLHFITNNFLYIL